MKEIGPGGFQDKVSKMLNHCGGTYFKLHGHAMQASGLPDCYIAHRIWRGWLELKVDGNKLSAVQKFTIRDLNSHGDIALVLRYMNIDNHVYICDEEEHAHMKFEWNDHLRGADLLNFFATVL